MNQDLLLEGRRSWVRRGPASWPYVALAGGIASCFAGYAIFWL